VPRQKQELPRRSQLEAVASSVRGGFSTVEEMTESFIREAILQGVLRPGDRLQQDEIAAVLGVSRMPVRASLRQLEAEGLLSLRPHRGAVVASLRPAEIAELYELRILLEGHLVGISIEHLTAEALGALEAVAERLEASSELSERLELRRTFYRQLYALADRPRAAALVEQLRASVGRYLLLQRVDESPKGHVGLLPYLQDRDAPGARAWLTAHLTRVSQELQDLVREAADVGESAPAPAPRSSESTTSSDEALPVSPATR
jgi:DNA-binding GntR family transcriptional regulator